MAATASRPTTCSALFAVSPDLASDGCGRLPRHKGEHRPTLTASKVARVGRHTVKATLAQFRTDLSARVDAGTITPSDALDALALFITRAGRSRRATVTNVAAKPSHPASPAQLAAREKFAAMGRARHAARVAASK